MFDLSGKRALVTGASTGLGRRFGWALARAGAEVVLAARSVDKLERLGEAIAAFGGRYQVVALDVRDRAAARACIDSVEAQGPIDVLVNNAGIAIVKAPERYTDDDWDAVYETNLRAPWVLAQAVIRHRLADGRPLSVINIASVLGLQPRGHIPPYAAAKAGLINLGRDLCVDLAARGIRVNALAPGYFETEMNRDWLQSPAGERLRAGIPAGRFGQPEDLDGAILFLASDASTYMNGNLIVVDGGHTAGL
ncbi:MAG: SDR family oxidoreductase [Gammaproteobacteria bacterium]|nr:SDR family oxidoreductase [Gammaproteobacteria bacterium]MCP5198543.1 SDR family oxidoreductase [Gammaproteobacteria bacterium]